MIEKDKWKEHYSFHLELVNEFQQHLYVFYGVLNFQAGNNEGKRLEMNVEENTQKPLPTSKLASLMAFYLF